MSSDHVVVDTDAHYLEEIDNLADYVDPVDPWHRRLKGAPGKVTPSNTPDHYHYGRIKREERTREMTPEDVPRAMDKLGIDKILMLSHTMISFSRIGADDRRPMVLARAYMEYMLDQVLDPDNGIYTAIPLPHQDPEESVELIDDYGDERGVVGVCMITAGASPPLGNRRYDVVYEAAQKRGLPVIFHAGGSSLDDFYIEGFEEFMESHSLGFLWSNMAQLTSILAQGTLEKFPDLDFVLQEAGIMWVPAYLARLDAEFMKRREEAPLLEKRPSEYAAELYYGTQPIEEPRDMEYFEKTIEAMGGPDQLMYASDYPHWDYDPPSSITDIPFLSEAEQAKVLGGNAEEVFGI
ncbi:MAG: amidohydrolase family protein [Haloferacaceae archaeon]